MAHITILAIAISTTLATHALAMSGLWVFHMPPVCDLPLGAVVMVSPTGDNLTGVPDPNYWAGTPCPCKGGCLVPLPGAKAVAVRLGNCTQVSHTWVTRRARAESSPFSYTAATTYQYTGASYVDGGQVLITGQPNCSEVMSTQPNWTARLPYRQGPPADMTLSDLIADSYGLELMRFKGIACAPRYDTYGNPYEPPCGTPDANGVIWADVLRQKDYPAGSCSCEPDFTQVVYGPCWATTEVVTHGVHQGAHDIRCTPYDSGQLVAPAGLVTRVMPGDPAYPQLNSIFWASYPGMSVVTAQADLYIGSSRAIDRQFFSSCDFAYALGDPTAQLVLSRWCSPLVASTGQARYVRPGLYVPRLASAMSVETPPPITSKPRLAAARVRNDIAFWESSTNWWSFRGRRRVSPPALDECTQITAALRDEQRQLYPLYYEYFDTECPQRCQLQPELAQHLAESDIYRYYDDTYAAVTPHSPGWCLITMMWADRPYLSPPLEALASREWDYSPIFRNGSTPLYRWCPDQVAVRSMAHVDPIGPAYVQHEQYICPVYADRLQPSMEPEAVLCPC